MDGRNRAAIKYLALFLGVAASLAASACGREEKETPVSRIGRLARTTLKPAPVLKVESREYTNDDFRAYLRSMGNDDSRGLPPESLSRLFDRFVDEKILLEAARQRNITLTDEEKRDYLTRLAGDRAAGVPAPKAGAPPSEAVFDGLLVDKYTYLVVRDIKVEDGEVQEYYDAHKKDFLLPERVQVSQILLPTEEKAVEVLKRVENASDEEFRQAAREESTGPEAAKGGVMGIYKPGDLPDDMAKVIFALEEGKVSRVVESSYGYHVFRLDRRFAPQLQPEAEVASSIRVRVLEQKIKDALAVHLGGLKDTLSWKAAPENLFFSYQRLDG